MKRWREVVAKPGWLIAKYGRAEGDGPDLCYAYGGGGVTKRDSNLLHNHLSPLYRELETRGYDVTTFKFSVQLKADRHE